MIKPTFLKYDKPVLTVMAQADNPDRIEELMKKSLPEGAEAFGIQICKLKEKYQSADTYKRLISAACERPVYVTNYRYAENLGKNDEELARTLIELSEYGATLCDVMGDYFAPCEGELTTDKSAIEKQIRLIDGLHKRGSEVLMSSHILKFTPAERVLEIALEHQRRGADISKIVVSADNMLEQTENLKITALLKENLKIPFLLLSVGECHVLRRIGGAFGSCMYLCVYEHDEFSTPVQPLLKDVKAIRDCLSTASLEDGIRTQKTCRREKCE